MVRREKLEHKDILLQVEKAPGSGNKARTAEIVPVRDSVEEKKAPTDNTSVIRITGHGITADLPQDISPELLTALLKGLSSC